MNNCTENRSNCREIVYPEQPFDLALHPTRNIIVAALISGNVCAHSYGSLEKMNIKCISSIKAHKKSCRSVDFSVDGAAFCTGSKDKALKWIDLESSTIIAQFEKAHSKAINKIKVLDDNLIASGDEQGTVKIWDIRQAKCTREYTANEDFISDFSYVDEKKTLVTTSADGCLSIFDIRQRKPVHVSENQNDELLSIAVVKHGKKAVVGTQDGILELFSWGNWGDCTDRIPGHPSSIDAIAKINESLICTGSSDGIIRMISILPNKFVKIIADLNGFPIESLEMDRNGWLASCSHDQTVRFWDVENKEEEIACVKKDGKDSDDSDEEDKLESAGEGKEESRSDSDHAPILPKKRKSKIKETFKTSSNKNAFFADMD